MQMYILQNCRTNFIQWLLYEHNFVTYSWLLKCSKARRSSSGFSLISPAKAESSLVLKIKNTRLVKRLEFSLTILQPSLVSVLDYYGIRQRTNYIIKVIKMCDCLTIILVKLIHCTIKAFEASTNFHIILMFFQLHL